MISLRTLRALAWLMASFLCLGQVAAACQAPGSGESSSRTHKVASHTSAPSPELGSLSGGLYRNAFFSIRYKAPYGWVDRTAEMREEGTPGKSLLLLATFSRPPQAAGTTVNSAVIIAAESMSNYPGLKTAADYFGPIIELTSSKGFQVVNQPYEFTVATKSLVRGDFSKDLGRLKMLQSTLVRLHKGYVLSFTFIAGDEEEIESLVSGLGFAGTGVPGPAQSNAPH